MNEKSEMFVFVQFAALNKHNLFWSLIGQLITPQVDIRTIRCSRSD